MRVIEIARAANVTSETVRYYTRKGLLTARRNPDNGYQLYNAQTLKQLRFIQQARTLGFSIEEISHILQHQHDHSSPCPMVRDLLAKRVPKVVQQIAELQALLTRMENALHRWQQMPDGMPDGHTICQLIENRDSGESGVSHHEISRTPAKPVATGRHQL